MVSRWASGQALPGLVYALEMEKHTQGGVPVHTWAGTELYQLTLRHNGVDWDTLEDQRAEERKRNWRRQRG